MQWAVCLLHSCRRTSVCLLVHTQQGVTRPGPDGRGSLTRSRGGGYPSQVQMGSTLARDGVHPSKGGVPGCTEVGYPPPRLDVGYPLG